MLVPLPRRWPTQVRPRERIPSFRKNFAEAVVHVVRADEQRPLARHGLQFRPTLIKLRGRNPLLELVGSRYESPLRHDSNPSL